MHYEYFIFYNAWRHDHKKQPCKCIIFISIDTLSVVILALQCAQRQRRLPFKNYIEEALENLLSQQAKDGSFAGNIHSTAMALQV